MPDVFSKSKRSEVMSRIRGRGNKDTELALMRVFRANGITGWRRNQRLFGKPDFVFPRQKLAVFVDGCFWHACPRHCKYAKQLKAPAASGKPAATQTARRRTGRAFWLRKLAGNKARDLRVNRALRRAGWRVLRIWEHELRGVTGRSAECGSKRLVAKLRRALGN